MRQLFILSVFLLWINNANGQGTWSPLASLPGNARAFSFVFSMGDTVYVCSGGNAGVTQSDFWAYHAASDSWIQKATPAFQSRQGVCFTLNGKAYMCAGIKLGSTTPNAEVWEYNPVSDTWVQKNNFPGGARIFPFAFSIGNKGYVGGGNNFNPATFFYDFWEYDAVSDQWTQIPNYPIPDYGQITGFELNGLGYAVGGFGSGTPPTVPVNRVWCFDPATNQWTQKNNFPINVGQATGFSVAGSGYILNGTIQLGSTATKVDKLYKYNSVTDTWTLQANFPGGARSGTHAAVINNVVYAGQGNGSGATCFADWFKYLPAGTTGITERDAENGLWLSPNPASVYVNIKFSKEVSSPIELSDMQGRIIRVINDEEKGFSVHDLPNGSYIIRTEGISNRLIVQH